MRTHRYQITISGGLGATAREAFADFRIEPNGINTALIGDLDQAALYGALNRILSLGLELVALTRLNDDPGLSAACGRSASSRRWDLPDIDEFQPLRPHAIKQGVQTALVELTGQDRDGRLHLDHRVSERLARVRAE